MGQLHNIYLASHNVSYKNECCCLNTKCDVFPNQVILVPKPNQIFVSWYVYNLPVCTIYFESLTGCNELFHIAALNAEPFISKTDNTGGVGRVL